MPAILDPTQIKTVKPKARKYSGLRYYTGEKPTVEAVPGKEYAEIARSRRAGIVAGDRSTLYTHTGPTPIQEINKMKKQAFAGGNTPEAQIDYRAQRMLRAGVPEAEVADFVNRSNATLAAKTKAAAAGIPVNPITQELQEIQLQSTKVPAMPPREAGATSEPMPKDRPVAKSGRTPRQIEMDITAEKMTGRENARLMAQRAEVGKKAEEALNAGSRDLFTATHPVHAEKVGVPVADQGSRIRAKLEGIVPKVVAKAPSGIMEATGLARVGRAASRIGQSPAIKLAGRAVPWLVPIGEAAGIFSDISQGRPGVDEEGNKISVGMYEPNEEDYAAAREGAGTVLGMPLIKKSDLWGVPIPGGVAGEVLAAGIFGPTVGAMLAPRQVLKAGAQGYKAYSAAKAAEEERIGSEAKYGTIERATATRKAMEPEMNKKKLLQETQDLLNEIDNMED